MKKYNMVAPSSLVILITIDCSTDPTISSCNEDSANCTCMCVSCPLCLKKTVWCVRSLMDDGFSNGSENQSRV